jgi:hypothetical protein
VFSADVIEEQFVISPLIETPVVEVTAEVVEEVKEEVPVEKIIDAPLVETQQEEIIKE